MSDKSGSDDAQKPRPRRPRVRHGAGAVDGVDLLRADSDIAGFEAPRRPRAADFLLPSVPAHLRGPEPDPAPETAPLPAAGGVGALDVVDLDALAPPTGADAPNASEPVADSARAETAQNETARVDAPTPESADAAVIEPSETLIDPTELTFDGPESERAAAPTRIAASRPVRDAQPPVGAGRDVHSDPSADDPQLLEPDILREFGVEAARTAGVDAASIVDPASTDAPEPEPEPEIEPANDLAAEPPAEPLAEPAAEKTFAPLPDLAALSAEVAKLERAVANTARASEASGTDPERAAGVAPTPKNGGPTGEPATDDGPTDDGPTDDAPTDGEPTPPELTVPELAEIPSVFEPSDATADDAAAPQAAAARETPQEAEPQAARLTAEEVPADASSADPEAREERARETLQNVARLATALRTAFRDRGDGGEEKPKAPTRERVQISLEPIQDPVQAADGDVDEPAGLGAGAKAPRRAPDDADQPTADAQKPELERASAEAPAAVAERTSAASEPAAEPSGASEPALEFAAGEASVASETPRTAASAPIEPETETSPEAEAPAPTASTPVDEQVAAAGAAAVDRSEPGDEARVATSDSAAAADAAPETDPSTGPSAFPLSRDQIVDQPAETDAETTPPAETATSARRRPRPRLPEAVRRRAAEAFSEGAPSAPSASEESTRDEAEAEQNAAPTRDLAQSPTETAIAASNRPATPPDAPSAPNSDAARPVDAPPAEPAPQKPFAPEITKPSVEVPPIEVPPIEVPRIEVPRIEIPRVGFRKAEKLRAEAAATEAPQTAAPVAEPPSAEPPSADAPAAEERPREQKPPAPQPDPLDIAPAAIHARAEAGGQAASAERGPAPRAIDVVDLEPSEFEVADPAPTPIAFPEIARDRDAADQRADVGGAESTALILAPTATAAPSPNRDRFGATLDALGRWTPALILLYVVALATIRLWLSPYLASHDAVFFGQTDLRLAYGDSNPPLYRWLLRGALEATLWSWATASAIVRYGLLAAFHILTWDAARRIAGPRAALFAVAASAFLPQIVWMSAHSYTHAVLAMTAAAATVHAVVMILTRPSTTAYVWLGAAIAIGALAKFNYGFLLIALVGAVALNPALRGRFYTPKLGLSVAVAAALTAPSAIAISMDFDSALTRMERLYSQQSWVHAVDAPYVGVDGLLSLIVATLAWVGPAAAVWLLARRLEGPSRPTATPDAAAFGAVLLRAMAIGLGLMALIVFAADMHRVHERYLTPLLAIAPIFLALAAPLRRTAPVVLATALLAYLAVGPGLWAMTTYGSHRLAFPYEQIASVVQRVATRPAPIVTPRRVDAANLTLALDWPAARSPRAASLENAVLLVWQGRGDPPAGLAPEGFGPASPIYAINAPMRADRERTVVFQFQRFERIAPFR